MEKIQKELVPLIRQVALQKGLDLVLNQGLGSNIILNTDQIDITNEGIRKYGEMSK